MCDDEEDEFHYYEGETREEQDIASHDVVQKLSGYYAGMTLSGKEPTAKVFEWKGRCFICVGALGSGKTGDTKIELRAVVPAKSYIGRDYDDKARGPEGYTGLEFAFKKERWRIEPYELELFSDLYVTATQEVLF